MTGGAGFIGSYLCDRLVHEGHAVTCVDNLDTGRFDNVRPLSNHRNFRFVEADVREPLVIEGPVDRIYHLACPASPPHYQPDPIGTVKTCVLGALHALELARATGARILQASTSEVYGDPAVHPQREDYWGNVNPIGIRSCYDEGKRCAETLCFDYNRQHGVRVKVARIFNTYGPRMHPADGRVVSNFIVQALKGEAITLYGDGSQTRSFCYVDDLVDAFIAFMETTPDDFVGPMNLGNPGEFSIRELAEIVVDLVGSKSRVEYHPLPSDDPKQRRPDISLAGGTIGWQPKITLREGLKETIDYFRKVVGS